MALRTASRKPRIKKIRSFIRAYSTQLSFASFILIFLTFSVGEGQAYDPNYFAANITDELAQVQAAGFVGKPQVIGETVLTGETQYAITYTVENGDSLLSIAKRYNTNVNTLIEANDIKLADIEKIKPGTELTIPSQDSDNSLAWLDGLNKLKAEEQEKAKQAELKRLTAQRQRSGTTSRQPRIAQAVGGVSIVGVFRNLTRGTAYAGQCTNYVMSKVPAFRSYVMGNGGQYLNSARRYGFKTGSTPVAGAVGVSSEARVGHVFMVDSVNGNGTITISEMNYVGPYVVSRRTIASNSGVIRGFIYP